MAEIALSRFAPLAHEMTGAKTPIAPARTGAAITVAGPAAKRAGRKGRCEFVYSLSRCHFFSLDDPDVASAFAPSCIAARFLAATCSAALRLSAASSKAARADCADASIPLAAFA